MKEMDIEEPSSSETNEEKRRLYEYRALCGPLLAATKSDWPVAKAFLDKHPECVRLPITKQQATVLHSATATKSTIFVEKLLKLITPDDLELTTIDGVTALHVAAQTGTVRIAKEMMKMNNKLPFINDGHERTPLHIAAHLGKRKMVEYLFSVTPFPQLSTRQRINLLLDIISAGFYDIALDILKMDPNLATAVDITHTVDTSCGWRALEQLAKKPFAISSESQLSFWKSSLNSCHKWIYNNALMRTYAHQLVEELWKVFHMVPQKLFSSELVYDHMTLLVEAAKVGNIEFLIILVRSFPDLLWQVDESYGSLFHIAITYRQESVFNLIYEIGVMKENITTYIDKDGNNMLHFAAKLGPSDQLNTLSIAAVQMQHELLWYNKIEKIVPPSYVNMKNSNGETPLDIFEREHKYLQEKGEKWMKQTANNCILVATLIATVVFAAAFTVPGGNDQITGKPIFLKSNWFTIFFISDAIAMVFSSTSILVFMSILTSRYREEDFVKIIPLLLLFGLGVLFVSIAGMVAAFSATCFLVYYTDTAWAPIVITTLATLPIALFVTGHFRIWLDTIHSTYWSSILFGPHRRKPF